MYCTSGTADGLPGKKRPELGRRAFGSVPHRRPYNLTADVRFASHAASARTAALANATLLVAASSRVTRRSPVRMDRAGIGTTGAKP